MFPLLVIDQETGCVLWTGLQKMGYGYITVNYKMLLVHRVMYEMFAEPIPEGLTIDHLCRVRNCVNVSHLEPVTIAENLRRRDLARASKAVA